jgi:ribonuclease Z
MKTEKLTVLGTGNAMVTKCYNTCFAIKQEKEYLLVDAGGGNGILRQLDDAGIPGEHIHHLIVTHGHTDHVLGVIWVIRKISAMMHAGEYQGDLTIYCYEELADMIRAMAYMTLTTKLTDNFGSRIHFDTVKDGDTRQILKSSVTFFDILSTKMKQFGFTMDLLSGKKLTCLGDEPYNEKCEKYITGTDYLLCEAFCLYKDRERFKPYEKHHSTVKDAAQLAQRLSIPNLILWHTEDKTIDTRKARYTKEGRKEYHGNLFVPDDLDVIKLK